MTIEAVYVFLVMASLLAMLYVGPSYFRRLGQLIEILRTDSPEIYEQLGRPSISFLDINIRSSMAMVSYVLRRKYSSLACERTRHLAESIRNRLFAWVIPFLLFAIAPIISALGGSL